MAANLRYLHDIQQACSHCSLAHLCLPYGLDSRDISRLEMLVHVSDPLPKNAELFAQGDELEAIYAIKSGAVKVSALDADGLEQIIGFYYPGDLLGLDALAEESHQCTATALEQTRFCRLPLQRLDNLIDELPSLRRQFMRIMSQALSEDKELLLTMGQKNSEGRVATLLLSLSRRRQAHALPPSPVRLSMKRMDLANFLGMRIETVSRVLRRLKESEVIAVDRSNVDILDFEALERWSSHGAWAADQ